MTETAAREALKAAKRTLDAYQENGAPHSFLGDIHLPKVHALIDAALATPVPSETRGLREALEDIRTHRDAWRNAITIAKQHAVVESPDVDDKGYWQHELEAFDRTFDALATSSCQGFVEAAEVLEEQA